MVTSLKKYAGKVRRFVKEWIMPPGITRAILFIFKRNAVVKGQKFWRGEPVTAPKFETEYFAQMGLDAQTITRHDDSRPCALIESSAVFKVPDNAVGQGVQIAVAADEWPTGSLLRINIGGNVTEHSGLRDARWGYDQGRWLDIRVEIPESTSEFEIITSAPIFVTCPKRVNYTNQSASKTSPRHVIVLVMDGGTPRLLNQEHPAHSDRPLTPNIDKFFKDGSYSLNAYSSAEWTLPTSASIFSGLYPSKHQMLHPQKHQQMPDNREMLAEILQNKGFHSLAMSTGNRLTPSFGSHRGFDRFVYHWPYEGYTKQDFHPAIWVNELVGHLETHKHDKTYSYLHFPDTHPAWNIGPMNRSFNLNRRGNSVGFDLDSLESTEMANDQGKQLFALRLHELDRTLAVLFDYIRRNIDEETLVILTSDHGTPWHHFRPSRPEDEPVLINDRINIPFFARGTNVSKGVYQGMICPSLDIMPTLLGMVDPDYQVEMDGVNLFGDNAIKRTHVISESNYSGVYEIAVNSEEHSWIEKYHINEETNLIDSPAFYSKLFTRKTENYSVAHEDYREDYHKIAIEHMTQMGLLLMEEGN